MTVASQSESDKYVTKDSRRVIASKEIFQDFKIIVIVHDEAEYVLRITRKNKLILQK